MISMMSRLRARCGDFWWYSMLLFIACRSGDAVQAFIGLWLVPHYVPQSELGAALPALQLGGVFGLPLTILAIPFARWLALYAARQEFGKVKRLLQLAFYAVGCTFVASLLVARFVLPHFFERLRIADGSLGFLIIVAGLIGPFSVVFNNALLGLKRFGVMALINGIGAPVRLVVMLVAMPFRALSGYMVGQIAAPAVAIGISCVSVRKELGGAVKSVALGRQDVRAMVGYTMPVAVNCLVASLMGMWLSVLFRQRLPEVESAAFYIISRLGEISTYVGMSMTSVVFPLAAEAREKGNEGCGLLLRLLGGTLLAGLGVTAFFACGGKLLLGLVPLWRDYVAYWPLLAVYALRLALTSTCSAFSTYEIAAGRFSFLWYWIPLTLVETGALAILTGYGALGDVLPAGVAERISELNAGRLGFFVWWLAGCGLLQLLAVSGHVAIRRRKGRWKAMDMAGER